MLFFLSVVTMMIIKIIVVTTVIKIIAMFITWLGSLEYGWLWRLPLRLYLTSNLFCICSIAIIFTIIRSKFLGKVVISIAWPLGMILVVYFCIFAKYILLLAILFCNHFCSQCFYFIKMGFFPWIFRNCKNQLITIEQIINLHIVA